MNGPTRVTSSSQTQIDLMFTNRPERIMKTYNLLTGISDHNITLLARKLTRKRFDSRVQTKCNSQRIPKNEMNNFENALRQIDWSSYCIVKILGIAVICFLQLLIKQYHLLLGRLKINLDKK